MRIMRNFKTTMETTVETIKEIKEATFELFPKEYDPSRWDKRIIMEGYIITTTNQIIKLGIANHQDCCENKSKL